jgi:hypothetical protein
VLPSQVKAAATARAKIMLRLVCTASASRLASRSYSEMPCWLGGVYIPPAFIAYQEGGANHLGTRRELHPLVEGIAEPSERLLVRPEVDATFGVQDERGAGHEQHRISEP